MRVLLHYSLVRPDQVPIFHSLKQEAQSRLRRQHIGARAMRRNRNLAISPLRFGPAHSKDSADPKNQQQVCTQLTN